MNHAARSTALLLLLVVQGCGAPGDPPTVARARTVVAEDATWQWTTREPAADWTREAPAPTGWTSAQAPLGFGARGLGAEVDDPARADPPGFTVYLRHEFSVHEPETIRGGIVRFSRDDGLALYLNGREVVRSNLPGGALGHDTRARLSIGGDEETAWIALPLEPDALVPGRNVLSARLHQVRARSSDLFFRAELRVERAGDATSILRGPYLQQVGSDAALVRWRTSAPVRGEVRFGPDETLGRRAAEGAPTTDHRVALTGLAPASQVHYAIGAAGEDASGERFRFRTAPAPGASDPVRLWITGDPGSGTQQARTVRDAFQELDREGRASAWLTLGDNAYPTGTAADLQSGLFDNLAPVLARIGLWPAIGNHDVEGVRGTERPAPYYDAFELPTAGERGGVPSGTESFYSFDHGNVHVVVLDSTTGLGRPDAPQLRWLRKDLAATTQDWVIAALHHPPMSRGTHDGDVERSMERVRTQLVPVLDAAGVDLVVGGHSHVYERTALLAGALPESADWGRVRVVRGGVGPYRKRGGRAPGTVYVVAGNAGQVGPGPLDHPGMVVAREAAGSLVVDVDGCQLEVQALDDHGSVFDRFRIDKSAPCGDPAARSGAP